MTVYLADPDVTLWHGDVLETLRGMPDGSVDCVITSPPYWGLRDYGTGAWEGGDPGCDHIAGRGGHLKDWHGNTRGGANKVADAQTVPMKDVCGKCGATRQDQQLGLEATPDLFVARMVEVFREVRRVLAPYGTCWVNLGDSYAGSWGAQSREKPPSHESHESHESHDLPKYATAEQIKAHLSGTQIAAAPKRTRTGSWVNDHPTLKPKDLVGIPWRVAFALQADGWYLRSDIVWAKPNPMPESVTDRPTKAHEYVFLLTKQPRYWFDQEAVREPSDDKAGRVIPPGYKATWANGNLVEGKQAGLRDPAHFEGCHPAGRNIRSVWEIATQPYPEAHFATYPEELVRRCLLAGTSERGKCPQCGAPWERIGVATGAENNRVREDVGDWLRHKGGNADGKRSLSGATYKPQRAATDRWRPTCSCVIAPGADEPRSNTLREGRSPGSVAGAAAARPDCTCAFDPASYGHGEDCPTWSVIPRPVPCVVLDPFVGSGTTAHVARKHGRHAVGIDLNADYLALAARRLQQQSLFAEGVA